MAVRRDVCRGGTARALRATARCARATHAHTAAHPLRRAQRSAAPSTTRARLQDLMAARRDVRRGGAAPELRAAARRARAPHARTAVHPLRGAQHAAPPPSTPARYQDLMAARRDVQRCGASPARRAAARRTRAPHAHTPARPLRRAQRTSAAPLTLTRLQDLVKARHDVQRGGAARTARAAARRTRAPPARTAAHPCTAHSAPPHRQAHRRDSTALRQHGAT